MTTARALSWLVLLCGPLTACGGPGVNGFSGSIDGIHVVGNELQNSSGQVIRLLGVDRSGTEYSCIHGVGIFDGPNDQASVEAIVSWKANAVRVPLNEDCWLGINGAPPAYSGAAYQAAISSYVGLLTQNQLVPILDLHWNGPAATQATGQLPMPDEDHASPFWSSVASTFQGNSSVVFDLYNEPYPADWGCWKNGGTCTGINYPVAGMQELVNTVRATGAQNVILLGGLAYSNDLSGWLANEPTDPQNQLAASVHVYGGNACTTPTCWDAQVAPVARQVPVVTGEFGESIPGTDCGVTMVDQYMSWADGKSLSYLAWAWDTWGNCESLVSGYTGTPTSTWGTAYQAHLQQQGD